jgi:hypothetical protein
MRGLQNPLDRGFTKAVTVDGFEPGHGSTAPPYLSLRERKPGQTLRNRTIV